VFYSTVDQIKAFDHCTEVSLFIAYSI